MNSTIKIILLSAVATIFCFAGGFFAAVSTVDRWHEPPKSDNEIALQRTMASWCADVPLRVMECNDRMDVCFCKPIVEKWEEE